MSVIFFIEFFFKFQVSKSLYNVEIFNIYHAYRFSTIFLELSQSYFYLNFVFVKSKVALDIDIVQFQIFHL